jgi:Flp pilus assembly protein TadD
LVNDDLLSAVLTHSWATVLDSENEVAHYNLSLAYERLGEYPQAIAHAQTAAKLEPENPHPLVALAIAHAGKGEVELAQNAFKAAIALDGRYRSASFLNGLDQSGFHPEQISQAKTVLESFQ